MDKIVLMNLIIAVSIIAIIIGLLISKWVISLSPGNEKMQEIAYAIQEGATAYLNRQYKTMSVVGILLGIILFFALGWQTAVGFIIGALFSALVGFIGMNISVRANVRCAEAAKQGLSSALNVAFKGGTVTGLLVVALALLGVAGYFYFLQTLEPLSTNENIRALIGLGFGGSLISVFARLGGGIYTKAADVGADLVGKLEAGIPEDDPRNPAVIADNVGDNVGDCAGMAADLFETYAVTAIAAMLLGSMVFQSYIKAGNIYPVIYPLALGAASIVASIVGLFFVKLGKSQDIMGALYKGLIASAIIALILFYPITMYLMSNLGVSQLRLYLTTIIGLLVTAFIVIITEYYTSTKYGPVRSIAQASVTGHATNIISGLAVSMRATALPVITIVLGILFSYFFSGLYGIAIAAMSMLSMTGIIVAIDSYGPITDNAGGIAEMCELPKEVREKTDVLDAVGNTTAAAGKGFAIASAALTALALFAAFVGVANIGGIDIYKADVLASLFVGGMIPYIFSSLAIKAVGQAAMAMVEEVRRQFKTIPGIMEGTGKPEYEKCVAISTDASIKKMMLPGAIAILSPIIIGFILGPEALGGFLAGATVSGVLLGMFQNNAGGAWDNAKKSFEKGVEINGEMFYKKSEPHKASVTGDTVGDPFKDTSGPSMNILIKLMSIVSLVIAPTLAQMKTNKSSEPKAENKIELKANEVAAKTNLTTTAFLK